MTPENEEKEKTTFEGQEAALERLLLEDFLKSRGILSMKDLCKLSEEDAKKSW